MTKNLVNFGPLTPEIMHLMFIYPKSTVRILRMLMHMTYGPCDFATGGISTLWIFFQFGLMALGGLALGFDPNF